MKSLRKFGSLPLWLLASVVITITFHMTSTSAPVNHQPLSHARHFSQAEMEPPAHLVEAALRKADFSQVLTPSEEVAMRRPVRTPSGTTLIPDHSLLVEAIPVVEDPNLTWDTCLAQNGGNGGNQNGAWTFNTLMLAIANTTAGNPQPAEQMLTNVLGDFAQDVTIGSSTAKARTNGMAFFNEWPDDPNGLQCIDPFNTSQQITCKSLSESPVHLNAIVNRVDTGRLNTTTTQAGQLRFVFGVTMDTSGNQCTSLGAQPFNLILEYSVPGSTLPNGFTAQSWAQAWLALSNDCPEPVGFTTACAQGNVAGKFDFDLNQIVSRVVTQGAGGPGAVNGSALFDLRTNEAELANTAVWEMRQFQLSSGGTSGTLVETPIPQTLDVSFDGGEGKDIHGNPEMFCSFYSSTGPGSGGGEGAPCATNLGEFKSLVQLNNTQILQGTFAIPSSLLAVSALNGPTGGPPENFLLFWDSSPSMAGTDPDARVILAAAPQFSDVNTPGGIDGSCNGCHGKETEIVFQQVKNRTSGTGSDAPSDLSPFLVGCTSNPIGGLTAPCGSPNLVPLNQASTGSEKVQDSVNPTQVNTFGDIQRRFNCMNKILNNLSLNVVCNGAGN